MRLQVFGIITHIIVETSRNFSFGCAFETDFSLNFGVSEEFQCGLDVKSSMLLYVE